LALAASAALPMGAGASIASRPSASLAATHHGKAVAAVKTVPLAGKCGSAFGTELPTPDGLIAWNDTSGSGFDTAGAADVQCRKRLRTRTIKQVTVNGYFGTAPTEQFNVTFYGNDGTNGSNEPDDSTIRCSYTNITGSPSGGQYPQHATTVIPLPTKCVLPRGTNWVSVQNYDAAGPWYWEMQVEQQGSAPDWIDRHDAFGSGCTTWSNDRYLVDCLGYNYGDFMVVLN
jgi:hypothetical protein